MLFKFLFLEQWYWDLLILSCYRDYSVLCGRGLGSNGWSEGHGIRAQGHPHFLYPWVQRPWAVWAANRTGDLQGLHRVQLEACLHRGLNGPGQVGERNTAIKKKRKKKKRRFRTTQRYKDKKETISTHTRIKDFFPTKLVIFSEQGQPYCLVEERVCMVVCFKGVLDAKDLYNLKFVTLESVIPWDVALSLYFRKHTSLSFFSFLRLMSKRTQAFFSTVLNLY